MPPAETFRVLTVCTGNMCRSPFTQLLLAGRIAGLGGPGAGAVEVSSAGTRAVTGHAVAGEMARLLAARGIAGADGFRARQLDEGVAAGASLILTATAEHRRTVLDLAPAAMRRTFTLLEFARLLSTADREQVAGTTWPERLAALAPLAQRQRPRHLGHDPALDDLDDPIGRSAQVYERVGERIASAVDAIVALARPE